MPCSAVTLSIATISAIIATALLAIAFSTDNWLHYEVKRNNIQVCTSFILKKTHIKTLINTYVYHILYVFSTYTYAYMYLYVCMFMYDDTFCFQNM